jgi:hypothetical protein
MEQSIMTKEDLNQIAWTMHELTLGGRPDPQTEALVHQTEELVSEIRRLHGVVREAASHLKDYDPKKAEQIVSQIDWTPTTPGL